MDLTRFEALAQRCVPGSLGATGIRRLSGGASQEIWSFDVGTSSGTMPLILRRARRWSEQGQAGSAGMGAEAALLRAAAVGGVPVPGVRHVLDVEDGLGEGFVMDRIVGETSGRKLVHDAAFDAIRPRLARDCGAIMARIHALDLAQLPGLRTGWAREERDQWLMRHRANGTSRPVFEVAFRWLAEHAPEAAERPVLVHGDFRTGNLIVGADGVRSVLDWELAHLGDPMEDLGWFCVHSWRFGRTDRPAGGLGSRESLFQGYEEVAGIAVDPLRVHFWEVLGTLKWGVTCDSMAKAFVDRVDRGIERAAIGRRASETEIDLLHLLAPGAARGDRR